MREKILTITAEDCEWDYYRGTGKGGQKRNKTSNCARCTHIPSGAVGRGEDGRERHRNRQNAFRRMAESTRFKVWLKKEISIKTGEAAKIEKKVAESMRPENIRVEVKENGLWVEISDKHKIDTD